MTEHPPSNHRITERFTVSEAAARLGITESAVRGRINRGTLEVEREEGAVYVLLSADYSGDYPGESSALRYALEARIESLEHQQELLERQLEQANERDRENRRLLAAALERIPELEPAERPPGPPVTATGKEAEQPPGGVQEGAQRPWWRRWFGT